MVLSNRDTIRELFNSRVQAHKLEAMQLLIQDKENVIKYVGFHKLGKTSEDLGINKSELSAIVNMLRALYLIDCNKAK